MLFNPSYEAAFMPGDTVIAVGEEENLQKLEKILNSRNKQRTENRGQKTGVRKTENRGRLTGPEDRTDRKDIEILHCQSVICFLSSVLFIGIKSCR